MSEQELAPASHGVKAWRRSRPNLSSRRHKALPTSHNGSSARTLRLTFAAAPGRIQRHRPSHRARRATFTAPVRIDDHVMEGLSKLERSRRCTSRITCQGSAPARRCSRTFRKSRVSTPRFTGQWIPSPAAWDCRAPTKNRACKGTASTDYRTKFIAQQLRAIDPDPREGSRNRRSPWEWREPLRDA